MTKERKEKIDGGRKELISAFEEADSLIYAAIATARDGVEDSAGKNEPVKHFLVIEDLLEQYRKTIYAVIDGKVA